MNIFSLQASLTRHAFIITPLPGSRSKTGKKITPKKKCYVIIYKINAQSAGEKTSISHNSVVIRERSVRSTIGGRNCIHHIPRRDGFLVYVSTSHAVGGVFVPQPDHTKDHHKSGTICRPTWNAILSWLEITRTPIVALGSIQTRRTNALIDWNVFQNQRVVFYAVKLTADASSLNRPLVRFRYFLR